MTHRTSVMALLALLPASAPLADTLGTGDSAMGANSRDSSCAGARTRPTRADAGRIEAAILCLVNRERRRHGLGRVRANRYLRAIAARQAHHMVASGSFSDSSSSPLRWAAASGYGAHHRVLAAGQNIGWGTGRFATAASIVASWMRSPAHRQIILTGRFRDAGTGVTAAPPRHQRHAHGATYVLELAARAR